MSSVLQNQSQPTPSSVLFARGVIARLSIWSILRIAVQEGWGGPGAAAKRTWIASEIVDAFETQNPVPDDQYIEELLLQILSDEFDTELEDGSAESVGVDVVRLWEETGLGKQDLVNKFEELAERMKGKRVEAQVGEEGEEEEWSDDDEAMDEDGSEEALQLLQPPEIPPTNEPEVDEDGFTLVKRGKGRR